MKSNTTLALDVGDKRIGVALSDRSGMIARPYDTFLRAKGAAEKQILQLVNEHDIKVIVVGMPLDEHNQPTKQCGSVEAFCRRLAKRVKAEFIFVDEYCTSLDAERLQNKLPQLKSRAARRADLDAKSAAILLQSFLDRNSV